MRDRLQRFNHFQVRTLSTPVLAAGLALYLSGCGGSAESDTPKVINHTEVITCGNLEYGDDHDPSNIEPTYLKNRDNYDRLTDPYVLLAYQQEHPEEFDYDIGIGTLVCNKVTDMNWDGQTSDSVQLLTQTGVQVAQQLQ